ncbi:MAG: endonuclease/exonuclease/phosphatase family protein [Stackebrandtia sp.]
MRSPRKRLLLAAAAAGAVGLPLLAAGSAAADVDAESKGSRIADIQGRSHLSSQSDEKVANIPGTVIAIHEDGFWMQDADSPNTDPRVSNGIYVYTRGEAEVAPGDSVTVSGDVKEYRPGGVDNANLTTTEIINPEVTVDGEGTAPEPALVGPGGRTAPQDVYTGEPGNVEEGGKLDVDANALDFYESMEGTLVEICDAIAVGPTNSYGELAVLPGGEGDNRTERGGVKLTETDVNTEVVILDDGLAEMPALNVGDELPGCFQAVVDYNFGNFKFNVLATPDAKDNDLQRETTQPQGDDLAVSTYNVENLHPAQGQEAFDRHGEYIATNLASPDVVGLVEIQDNSGPDDDGTVDSNETLDMLVDSIAAAGGPSYEWRQISPENNADGGQPGGNIRVAYLFNPDRVTFDDREGGDAVTPVEVTSGDGGAALSFNPGRVAPTEDAWGETRKPLAAEFEFNGEKYFTIVNHFSSKGEDDPLNGRYQPPTRHTEEARHQQAQIVADFVGEINAADPEANVVVLGDVNDFEFSETAKILTENGHLANGLDTLKETERYSYVFNGNSQVLDQILVSPHLLEAAEYDVVHVNSEFHDQASDHEPSVIRFSV